MARAVLGGVDVGGAQVGDQQFVAAEDVQRQEAVVVVVAVEEAALLVAVDAVVGGVEVQHQVLRRRRMGGDELLDQHRGYRTRVWRSMRFSSRHSVGGEASGESLSGALPAASCRAGSSRRVWWSLRSS